MINMDTQDAQDFSGNGQLVILGIHELDRIVAQASFPCRNLTSCLSCASCASMFKKIVSAAPLPGDPCGERCSTPWSGHKEFHEERYTYTSDHWNHRPELKADLS